MFKTVKEFDEQRVTKKNNIPLTREPTHSQLSVNFQYSDEINNSLIIEGYVTKSKKSVRQIK